MSSGNVATRTERVLGSLRGFLSVVAEVESARAHGGPLCDFTAGTPHEMASRAYVDALTRWAEPRSTDWYGYRTAHEPARQAAAAGLGAELGIAFDPEDIILTRGAHGALGAALNAVVDVGDGVILAPGLPGAK